MPNLSVPGGNLHYELVDQGPAIGPKPWLAIFPGMAMQAAAYLDFATHLAADFRVVILNHRGIPPSDAPLPPLLTMRKAHEDTFAIFAKLGIRQCHVLGESYGGMLAMSLAEFFPATVKSLFAVNTSLAGKREFRLSPRALAKIGPQGLTGKMWQGVAAQIFSKNFQKQHPEKFADWLARFGHTPFPNKTAVLQAVAAGLYHGRGVAAISVPTHFIFGTHDTFVSPANSAKIQRLVTHSKLIEMAEVGHHICGEAPDKLAGIVRAHCNPL